jgi:hypothetical protein
MEEKDVLIISVSRIFWLEEASGIMNRFVTEGGFGKVKHGHCSL